MYWKICTFFKLAATFFQNKTNSYFLSAFPDNIVKNSFVVKNFKFNFLNKKLFCIFYCKIKNIVTKLDLT